MTGYYVKPQFIVNKAQFWRKVYGWSHSVVGQVICKYGPETYYQCGEVDTTNYAPHWVPYSYGFVRAYDCDAHMSVVGDSGGPVFLNRRAYGLVSGYQAQACNFFGPHMLIYGKIGPALAQFNLELFIAE